MGRMDDMRQNVQTDQVRSTVSGGTGPSQKRTGQVIHQITGQPKILGLVKGEYGRGNPNPIGHEIRRVQGMNDSLAQTGRDEGFQNGDTVPIRSCRGDQFHQRHVTGGIEEMHATEARLAILGQCGTEFFQRQAGGIGDQPALGSQVRQNTCIECLFPGQLFTDGFNNQITGGKPGQMFVIIGCFDQVCPFGFDQRRRTHFLQSPDGLQNPSIRGSLVKGQIIEQNRNVQVDEVRCQLRPHDPGPQHGHALNLSHPLLPSCGFICSF